MKMFTFHRDRSKAGAVVLSRKRKEKMAFLEQAINIIYAEDSREGWV